MFRKSKAASRKPARRPSVEVNLLEPRLLLSDVGEEFYIRDRFGTIVVDHSLPVKMVWSSFASATPLGANPLSAVPALNSNSGATAKIYLDFNGAAAMAWGSFSATTTPAYTQDGDATTFTDGEITSIRQIWARVAEAYSPFNINVTTVDPTTYGDKQAVR